MSTPRSSRPHWRKSTHSGGDEGNCVEVADLSDQIAIRDSKSPETPHLTLTRQAFTTLLTRLR
ncbi:DUF397 domain-containing protein [Actinomadura litoris]|uniref:DUF397 domain-containing protein n=1 Tax=Actinomadura litoris TaxID=2678616 RepID=UPI001FA6C131|nr:DUF397 domain-containing protein [Actinomadura litoris]